MSMRTETKHEQNGAKTSSQETLFQSQSLLTIELQKHIPEQQKHKLWFGKELKKLDASAS